MELGKNAETGDCYLYASPESRTYGINAGESLIQTRGHSTTTTGIVDPYGLIVRWKTSTISSDLAASAYDSGKT